MRGLQLGTEEIITKPFESEALGQRIEAVIERSRLKMKRLQYRDIEVDVTVRQARQNSRLDH